MYDIPSTQAIISDKKECALRIRTPPPVGSSPRGGWPAHRSSAGTRRWRRRSAKEENTSAPIDLGTDRQSWKLGLLLRSLWPMHIPAPWTCHISPWLFAKHVERTTVDHGWGAFKQMLSHKKGTFISELSDRSWGFLLWGGTNNHRRAYYIQSLRVGIALLLYYHNTSLYTIPLLSIAAIVFTFLWSFPV